MLTKEHAKVALSHLNEICPDTFDEGEFGPWTFTELSRDGDDWTLEFDNSEGGDAVGFAFEGDCVSGDGGVVDEWFEKVNAAILAWEAGMSDY